MEQDVARIIRFGVPLHTYDMRHAQQRVSPSDAPAGDVEPLCTYDLGQLLACKGLMLLAGIGFPEVVQGNVLPGTVFPEVRDQKPVRARASGETNVAPVFLPE